MLNHDEQMNIANFVLYYCHNKFDCIPPLELFLFLADGELDKRHWIPSTATATASATATATTRTTNSIT
jgi:hypothetical protein